MQTIQLVAARDMEQIQLEKDAHLLKLKENEETVIIHFLLL
jgi:hypothetical protein